MSSGTALEPELRAPSLPLRIVLPLLLALSLAAIGAGFWGFSYDDAFITYRYARNWAAGEGLAYNPGEAVLGTTAPGHALLLGLLTRLTPAGVPGWGTALSLASLLIAAAVLAAGARQVWLIPFYGTLAAVLRWDVEMLGAESFPVLALACLSAWLACARHRPAAAGLLAAAAMALRLDAALAALALGLVLWARQRRVPFRFALAGLAPLALWLGWLWRTFGTVVPNTLAAKRSELPLIVQSYTWAEWSWLRRGLPLAGCLVLLALALAGLAAGLRQGTLRRPLFAALGLWVVLHEIAYRFLAVPFAPWYQVYSLQAFAFLASLGALALGGRIAARAAPGRGRSGLALVVAAALLLPVFVPSLAWVARQWGRPPDPRFALYREAGRFLAGRGPAEEAVAAVEIGVLGYYAGRPVLDLMGLVSPEALRARAEGRLGAHVAAALPRHVVDAPPLRAAVLAPVLEHPAIAGRYRAVAVFARPEYGGEVRVLERLD